MRPSKTFCEIAFAIVLVASAVCVGARYWPVTSHGTTVSMSEAEAVYANHSLESKARMVLGFYCASCHVSGRSGADFDEDSLHLKSMREDRATWEMVVQKVRGHTMPPKKYPQPSDNERAFLIEWVEKEVLADTITSKPRLARPLQRSEYLNTVRDLFGVSLHVTGAFPAKHGTWEYCDKEPMVPADLAEKYRHIAHDILAEAVAVESATRNLEDDEMDEEADSLPHLDHARVHAIFFADPAGQSVANSAREILESFARRAYRRPVNAAEIDELVAVFEHAEETGATFDKAMSAALEEVLTSPHFLYRVESSNGAAPKSRHEDQFALASRLSYFLWTTMPDDELLDLAERGMLTKNLDKQVLRMLKDPRSQALSRDFAAYWIGLHKLDHLNSLDVELRHAMRLETEEFTAAIVHEDRHVVDFLGADFTFVNERLAKHYGIAGVHGEHMRRISVRGTERGGLLTQASALNLTPMDDTSPVQRGKWILENFMGATPVRPPAGILEALNDAPKKFDRGTVREQLAMHRTNPSCADCHWKMDAVGISLENFDSFGAWRTELNKYPVDAVGLLPDGETVHGPAGLKAYLLKQPKQFVRGLSGKLLAYALGRKLDPRDRTELDAMPDRVAPAEYRFSTVILDVVQSESFLMGSRAVNRQQPTPAP